MRRKRVNHIYRGISILASTILFIVCAIPVRAANIQMIPTIALDGAWDSNIFNANTDETSDSIFRARPRLTFFINAYQTTILVGGGIVSEWYADNSDLDSITAAKDATLSVENPMQLSPRLTLRPFFRFVESEDAVQRNELTQAPTPDIPPSQAIVTERQKERLYQGFLRFGYRLTPRTDVFLGGGITEYNYSGDSATTGNQDSRTVNGDVSFLYQLTPRFASGMFYNAGFNSFEQAPDSETDTVGLEARYRLTELHTLRMRGGATYLHQSGNNTTQGYDEWHPYGGVDLTYGRRYMWVSMQSTYEVTGGSFGQTTERWNMALRMKDRITETWSWNLSGAYQTNQSNDEPQTVNVDTFQGKAGVECRVVEWATVMLSGIIVRQSSSGTQENDVDRESVILGVRFGKPYKPF